MVKSEVLRSIKTNLDEHHFQTPEPCSIISIGSIPITLPNDPIYIIQNLTRIQISTFAETLDTLDTCIVAFVEWRQFDLKKVTKLIERVNEFVVVIWDPDGNFDKSGLEDLELKCHVLVVQKIGFDLVLLYITEIFYLFFYFTFLCLETRKFKPNFKIEIMNSMLKFTN